RARWCSRLFLVLPRPPLSTLFPYTTLFRSLLDVLLRQGVEHVSHERDPGQVVRLTGTACARLRLDHVLRAQPQPQRADLQVLLRSEEHTSELQSRFDLVCRLLLEKKKTHAT